MTEDPDRLEEATAEFELAAADAELQASILAEALRNRARWLAQSAVLDAERRAEECARAARAAEFQGKDSEALDHEDARAMLLADAGRTRDARDVLVDALARLEGPEVRRLPLELRLADLHRKLGDLGPALELVESLEARTRSDAALARAVPALAPVRDYVYLDLGLTELAWPGIQARAEQAERALASGEVGPDELLAARLALVHLLRGVGDEKGAIDLCRRTLEDEGLVTATGDEARWRALLAAAELDSPLAGAAERGRAEARRALELGAGAMELFLRLELAEQALREGDLAAAESELALARALRERGARDEGPEQERDLLKLEARLALARGDPPARLAELRAALDAAIDGLIRHWSRVPEREGGVAYLLFVKRRELVGEAIELSLALDGPEAGAAAGLERVLELQALGTLARRAGAGATDLETIRAELLGPGHGALVYVPTDWRSHVFALDGDGVAHALLARSNRLNELRGDWLSHLYSADAELGRGGDDERLLARERELARALADALLPPALRARVAGWSALSIVGLDLLGPLPFEWLPLGERPYLGVDVAIDCVPSLPLAVACSARPARRFGLDYLLVGGAEPSAAARARWPGLAPLPLDEGLERELSGAYSGRAARTLRGAEATRAALAAAPAPRVLQFLVHGVHEHERERSLALLVTPDGDGDGDGEHDGLLRWEDAARLPAPALVLLTGCKTGRAPMRKGDPDVGAMQGAWLAAGADAVVLADVDLALSEVRALSGIVSARLVEGATPAEALREVRAGLVREHGAAAPFRGGLVRVVGLGHRPVLAPAPRALDAHDAPASPVAETRPSALLAGALGVALGLALAAVIARARAR